ncbi:MAG: AAA family ATPase [Acidobacteriota bacterium]
MRFERIVEALGEVGAYRDGAKPVEMRRTHISVVFLVGSHVYKLKRPVKLDFLDYSSPDLRRRFCEEEVRLNRRLAPDVYEGVVPIVRRGNGVEVEGDGTPLEHAVKMRRLPDRARLLEVIDRQEQPGTILDDLATRLARFHAGAARGAPIAAHGRFDAVVRLVRGNFEQSTDHVGSTVDPEVFRRLRGLSEAELERRRDRIEARAARGMPCDGHGDLRLEHVYRIDGHFAIIDCIEFNERFRHADPVADTAFLTMDLAFRGYRDLARRFQGAYTSASGDEEGDDLFPLYTAYRAAVRAKVQGIKQAQESLPAEERRAARERARAFWLLALDVLEPPRRRPALLLMGGLPGTGKTTLARGLGDKAGFSLVRTDRVRREIAGDVSDPYTERQIERTYDACLDRARDRLLEGERVIVDATFRSERHRVRFLEAARRLAVRSAWLFCETQPEVARRRLRDRSGDLSEADRAVYRRLAETWEPPGELVREHTDRIPAGGGRDETLRAGLEALRHRGLLEA